VAASQRPLVDENDWRVSRAKVPVRTSEPVAATGCRATGCREPLAEPVPAHYRAFAAPKPATTSIAPPVAPAAESPAARPAAENVVAVAPKAAARRRRPRLRSISTSPSGQAHADDDDLQIPAFLRRQAN